MATSTPPRKRRRETFSDPVKLFVEALIANPNITRAYMLAYPNCKPESASASGSRLFRNVKVREAVEEGRRRRLKELEVDADEAMLRISLIGRVDPRQLFDHEGKMLDVQEWPAEIALAVKGIEEKELGTKVTFDSRLAALELIAVAGGKMKGKTDTGLDVLAMLLEHAKPEDKVPAAKGKR